MNLSFSSLITNLLFNSIAIIILYVVSLKNKYILLFEIRFLMLCMILGIIRFLFPFEFLFTKSIYIERIWPNIFIFFYRALYQPLFTVSNYNISLINILAAVWLTGTAVYLLKIIVSYFRFASSIKHYQKIAAKEPPLIIEQINKQYKKSRKFQLYFSPALKSPLIFGIFRPKIIMPAREYTNKEWYYILSHEVAHYYNKDLVIKLLIELFIAIIWWNPLLYLLKRRLNAMLEIHIDLIITKNWNTKQTMEYLKCLFEWPQRISLLNSAILPSAAFKNHYKSSLTQRIRLILYSLNAYQRPSVKTRIILRFIPLMALVLPMLIIFEPSAIPPEDKMGTFAVTDENNYYIENDEGAYDFYLNGEYMLTHDEEVMDFQLKVYKNIEEVLK